MARGGPPGSAPYYARMNIDKLGREGLMAVIHEIAQGGKWHCGVEGNRKLARRLRVRPEELETLSSYGWNRIAELACLGRDDKLGASVYRLICDMQFVKLPVDLQWERRARARP